MTRSLRGTPGQQKLVDQFNSKYPVGTRFRYFPIRGDRETYRDGGAISVQHLEPLKA